MASQVVEMEYAPVMAASKGFQTAADTLKTIGKALEVAIQMLTAAKSGAFLAAPVIEALIQYLEGIKRAVQNLMKICTEFSGDLKRAVDDHKSGDYKAGQYFGEGVS